MKLFHPPSWWSLYEILLRLIAANTAASRLLTRQLARQRAKDIFYTARQIPAGQFAFSSIAT
jgi:enoyl-CoA hydratase/carnithine racemase